MKWLNWSSPSRNGVPGLAANNLLAEGVREFVCGDKCDNI
jgi:hypothetical protein